MRVPAPPVNRRYINSFSNVQIVLLTDVDECTEEHDCGNRSLTHKMCLNAQGSYTCPCESGYALNDENECEGIQIIT